MNIADKVLASVGKRNPSASTPPDGPPSSGKDAGSSEYRSFPTELLPDPLRQFVEEGEAAFGCDPGYLGLPILVVCAGAIGNTRCIELKRGFRQPSIVWGAVVGRSGSMKTPPFEAVMWPIYKVQHEWIEEGKLLDAEYADELERYQARRGKALREGSSFAEEAPERPLTRRIVVQDTTVERIAVDLDENPRGLVLARSEIASWLGSFARYRSAGSDLQTWLEFYDASSIIVDRKGGDKKTRSVRRASVSVIGGIPPGTLQAAFSSDNLEAGLGARVLIVFPPDREHPWSEVEISPATVERYADLVKALLNLGFPKNDPSNGPEVHRLGKEAKAAWVGWYNAWEKKKAGTEFEPLRAAYSKLHGIAARLTLLHHVVSYVQSYLVGRGDQVELIGPESVRAGTALAEWFGAEAARFYLTLPTEDDLVEWIRKKGRGVTVRDLVSSRKFANAEDAKIALTGLVCTMRLKCIEEGKKTLYFPFDMPEKF